MDPRLVYSRSNNNLRAHVLRRQGHEFALINLLYHVTLIFLHREYLPFLPHRVARPQGPIDPPLLPHTHPAHWWESSSQTLFKSAVAIVDIIHELELNDVQLRTPLMGFWVYTAVFALHYGHHWPHMTCGMADMQGKYEWALPWLRELSHVWRICAGWTKTIENLELLYTGIKEDVMRYLAVGRDSFVDLEDNVQRLAEVEVSPSESGETARTLIALSRVEPVSPPQAASESMRNHSGAYEMESSQAPLDPRTQDLAQCTGYDEPHLGNFLYNYTAVDDLDGVMRMLLANQNSVDAFLGGLSPDESFTNAMNR